MTANTPKSGPSSPPVEDQNQGEGNREAARRYNKGTQAFIESPDGQTDIERAGEVDATDVKELEAAEASGKARSKGEDSGMSKASEHR